MAGRAEYKYLVPNDLVDEVRDYIRPYTELDPFSGKLPSAEYTVRSVYYDTLRFQCYDQKLDGLKARRKFRIRGYGTCEDDSLTFLEIKRKDMELIEKSRAPVLYKDVDTLLSSGDIDRYVQLLGPGGEEKRDARRFLFHYKGLGLRPAALVVYEREAFFGKHDRSLRLSFDKDLRGAMFPSLQMLYDNDCLHHAMAHYFTLEVKFFRRALPQWVKSLVNRYELPRMALSKYTICVDNERGFRERAQMKSRAFSPVRDEAH